MKTRNCLLTISFIVFAFFIPFLIKPELLTIRDNDLGRTYIPIFSFFKDSIINFHQFPTWRPSQMMGESLIASPLWSPLYPANIIFLIFPVNLASIIYLLFHFELAAIATFFLARSFKLLPIASFAAALFFAFSTKMLLHTSAGHITMIAAVAFIPLSFLALRKLIITPQLKWIVTGTVSLSAMYITYPTVFYYTIIFLGVYSLYKYHSIKKTDLPESIKYFLPLAILGIITLGLSAVVLLPQLEFGPYSTRSVMSFSDVAQPLWNLKRFAQSLLFPYVNFSSFDHEAFLYFGIVPGLLAIIGFWHLSKNKKLVVGIIGGITLAFVAGASTPVFKIAYDFLPILKYSRITTRLWFNVALVVALLAAFGLSKIKSKLIIYVLLIFFLAENLFIGYKKILSIPNLSFTNESLYQYLANDDQDFRVYCTTYCFNPQLLAKYKIQMLAGETPVQDKNVVAFLEKAGNYNFNKFAVIFPPYQVWQVANPPQPNPSLLAQASVKYVASTYPLTDQNLKIVGNFQNIILYQNLLKPGPLTSISYVPKTFSLGLGISVFSVISLAMWYIFQNKSTK